MSTDTMMAGYWERPDLTSAAVELGGDPPRRWYRTGDLVTVDADGLLVFLGRRDHQVKVRGHRIELEAIELLIADHPDVATCAVVVDADRLVAVVAPDLDDEAVAGLMTALAERLPRWSVPDEIVGVASLPRTGTGKVDRSAAAELLVARR